MREVVDARNVPTCADSMAYSLEDCYLVHGSVSSLVKEPMDDGFDCNDECSPKESAFVLLHHRRLAAESIASVVVFILLLRIAFIVSIRFKR